MVGINGFSFDFREDEFYTRVLGIEVRNQSYVILLPLTVSRLFGNEKKFFEVTAGVTPMYISVKKTVTRRSNRVYFLPALYAGYRRQPPTGGFLFRTGINTVYYEEQLFPILGLSFGYAFKRGK